MNQQSKKSSARLPGSLRQASFSRSKGFTLVELMVALVVALVFLSLAIPSMGWFVNNNRVAGLANDFTKSVTVARSESLKRGVPVSICSSTDQATCAGSTDWSTGWIVFTDNSGTAGTLDDTDALIYIQDALRGSVSFSTTVNSVQYNATGSLATASNITFSLTPQNCNSDQRRDITIRPQGYSTVAKASCS
jgi:type IV fimbrial biogenesis protein FimT